MHIERALSDFDRYLALLVCHLLKMILLNQICFGGRHCIRMRDANENTISVERFLQSALSFIATQLNLIKRGFFP